ncbi:MAG: hypothetical protein JXM71_02475 [Spirochaetales bacterium]|nr:hypothetical protein [Spirochaetales bacterium]
MIDWVYKPCAKPEVATDPATELRILRENPLPLVAVAMTNWSMASEALSLIMVVAKRFFIDQFTYKLFPGSVPIKNIEHPLDEAIPVRYETAALYLSFVRLWVSSLSYFRSRVGASFDSSVIDFLAGIKRCYIDASSVYGRCLTTTKRPDRAPNPRLALVYAVDPHLFCVPSLHVLIVCYTYAKLDQLLGRMGLRDEYCRELTVLRKRALAITESVLYVRQHSINCIPTALFMLSEILPAYDDAEARSFISCLFADDAGVHPGIRGLIQAYMKNLYDTTGTRGVSDEDPYEGIVRFLRDYDVQTVYNPLDELAVDAQS